MNHNNNNKQTNKKRINLSEHFTLNGSICAAIYLPTGKHQLGDFRLNVTLREST